MDRIGRSVVNVTNLFSQLTEYNLEIELLDQPIDSSTPVGRYTLTMLSATAEFERELIRDRTRDGLARAKKNGKIGGHPKIELTNYQREKIKEILKENPNISNRQLATQFIGISPNTFIKLAKEEKYIK